MQCTEYTAKYINYIYQCTEYTEVYKLYLTVYGVH